MARARVGRLGAMVAVTALVACTLDTSGFGQEEAGGSSSTSTSTTAGSSSSSSSSPTATDSMDGTGSTTRAPPDSTTASSSDETSGTTGGAPVDPLVDRGLLVRYYLDEADAGQGITEVVDAAPGPLNLPVIYSSDPEQPVFFAAGGNRGLEWITEISEGAPMINVNDTKVQIALDGTVQGTIEVVADIDQLGTGNDSSRFITVGNNTDAGDFGLSATVDTGFWFRFNDTTPFMWSMDIASMGRIVIHLVMDTEQASAQDRAVLYVDGMPVVPTSGAGPAMGAAVTVEDNDEIIIGNVSDENRSPDGRIFYAAMYDVALTPDEVANNVGILTLDDDSPR